MPTRSERPVPVPRGEEREFFERLERGQVVFGRCAACGLAFFYPRTVCPGCHSEQVGTETAAGRGRVHSWTTQYRAGAPGLAVDVPYTLALVDLDEGVRLLADVVGVAPESLCIGEAVEAVVELRPPAPPVLHFVRADAAARARARR